MICADLHLHTNYSDGIYEPEDVFRKVKEKEIQYISITDHDTFFHYPLIQQLGIKYDIKTIPGVEISCYNYEKRKKVHIVGLFLNEYAPNVTTLCNKILQKRNDYHKELILQFQKMGYEITYQDAKEFSPHNIVFKMNIFQALKKKYPELDDNFYKKYFQGKVPFEVEIKMGYASVKEGIEAVLLDGGVPVLAHPNFYDSFPDIEEYVSYGLKGIEVDHHSMNDDDRLKARYFAEKYNLMKSGGSDFHKVRYTKDHKENLGTFGLTDIEIKQLLEDQKKWKSCRK